MSSIPAPLREDTIVVSGGRRVGFAEYGAADGRPLLWFHGTPGARGQIPSRARSQAAERGVRIIALERPGTGLSTGHLYSAIVDWARDVERVADALGCNRFGVVGLSGGGPYVLAVAHQLPHRVVGGLVLGGVGPTKGPEAAPGGIVKLASYVAPLLAACSVPLGFALTRLVRLARPLTSPAFDLYMRLSPEGDRRVFAMPDMKEMFTADIVSAAKTSLAAPAYDLALFGRHWGFSLADIRVPIRFWHGDADNIVPLEHAEHQTALVPDAELRVRPGESHLGSLAAADEILDAFLGFWTDHENNAMLGDDPEPKTSEG